MGTGSRRRGRPVDWNQLTSDIPFYGPCYGHCPVRASQWWLSRSRSPIRSTAATWTSEDPNNLPRPPVNLNLGCARLICATCSGNTVCVTNPSDPNRIASEYGRQRRGPHRPGRWALGFSVGSGLASASIYPWRPVVHCHRRPVPMDRYGPVWAETTARSQKNGDRFSTRPSVGRRAIGAQWGSANAPASRSRQKNIDRRAFETPRDQRGWFTGSTGARNRTRSAPSTATHTP